MEMPVLMKPPDLENFTWSEACSGTKKGLNSISMAVFTMNYPCREKTPVCVILDTAERMMEISAFRDSGNFRFFAEEESRDPKTGRFSSGACFLLERE